MSHVTNVDTLDQRIFSEIKGSNEFIREMEKERSDDSFSDLLTDGFGSFFKYSPKVKDNVAPERAANRHIIKQVMGLKEYEELRHYTRGDKFHSTSALNAVKESFDSLPEDIKDTQKQLEEMQKALDDELNSDSPDPEKLKEMLEGQKQAEQTMQDQCLEAENEIRQTIRNGLHQAQEEAEQYEDMATALGCGDDPGQIQKTPTSEKMKIAQFLKNNEMLLKIAKLAGRFIRIAERKQKERVDYAREEIENITKGNDLTRLVPYEILKLADPDLSNLFLKDYLENSLFQYSLKGKDFTGQGPVLVCVDTSGSMQGTPDAWAKGTALALYMIASKQKRAFGFILFDTVVQAEVFIPAGEKNLEGLVNVLTTFSGGGTKFQPPLKRCLELISADEWNKADVTFITDGEAHLDDQFLDYFKQLKQAKEFNVLGIRIGNSHYGDIEMMSLFCDDVFNLEGLFEANEDEVFNKAFTI
jgi:uncharacterized protein with von Willebrand factor type A (vWA) domain